MKVVWTMAISVAVVCLATTSSASPLRRPGAASLARLLAALAWQDVIIDMEDMREDSVQEDSGGREDRGDRLLPTAMERESLVKRASRGYGGVKGDLIPYPRTG